jgi:hypothetical protein
MRTPRQLRIDGIVYHCTHRVAAQYKYLTDRAALCLYCKTWLQPAQLTWNPRHMYHIGTQYRCRCGKSRIWCNSIRAPQELLAHWDSGTPYHAGFCNDMFCGFTYAWALPLQNRMPVPVGFEAIERNLIDPTRYGNAKHPTNHNIALWQSQLDPDGGEAPIQQWYSTQRPAVHALLASKH